MHEIMLTVAITQKKAGASQRRLSLWMYEKK